jgi:predicted nucleotidyltransferase component of viral defense system
MITNPYEATERFHLLFVAHLAQKIDSRLFAVKGGCNLRFFFKSVRYSEDIDLDVQKVATTTLRANVRNVLRHKALIDSLKTYGVEIVRQSEPKQTDTTQRWKIALGVSGYTREIPTKIEFSRRTGINGALMESVDRDIIAKYHLFPINLYHYPRIEAIKQKISALIGRTQTQARDVFDLAHLIHDGLVVGEFRLSRKQVEEASDNALSISYDAYRSQVVDFLMPEYQRVFGTTESWNDMVSRVIDFIQRVKHEPS